MSNLRRIGGVDCNLSKVWGVDVGHIFSNDTENNHWTGWGRYTSFRRTYQAYKAISKGKYVRDRELRIVKIFYGESDIIKTPIDLNSYLREEKLKRILG